MAFSVERTNPDVLTIRHTDVAAGWRQRYLLMSDVHFDSPHCDRRLLTKHLNQAREAGAGVICVGDWFDAMGGKNDKRASKSTIRSEDKVDNYFDALVDRSVEFLEPYRDNLVMLSDGNHETAIIKHNETDLLERLCRQLGTNHMGYSGFIRFMFQGEKGRRTTRRYYWHHGYGGGGPVTKGVIGNQRRAATIDADIFHTGHVHEAITEEFVRVKMNDSGRVYLSTELHIITPGYKQEYDLRGGFQLEKGNAPKATGAYWLDFYYDTTQLGNIGFTPARAN